MLRFVMCVLGALGAGYIGFGTQIFNPELTYFQFVSFGVVVGGLVAIWPLVNARWLGLAGVLAFLAVVLVAHSQTPARLLRDAVGVLSVIAAVKLCLLVDHVFPALKVGKFIVWAAIFASAQSLAVLLLILVKTHALTVNPDFIKMVVNMGALLGAGTGLGYELANLTSRPPSPTLPQQGLRSCVPDHHYYNIGAGCWFQEVPEVGNSEAAVGSGAAG